MNVVELWQELILFIVVYANSGAERDEEFVSGGYEEVAGIYGCVSGGVGKGGV